MYRYAFTQNVECILSKVSMSHMLVTYNTNAHLECFNYENSYLCVCETATEKTHYISVVIRNLISEYHINQYCICGACN